MVELLTGGAVLEIQRERWSVAQRIAFRFF